MKRNPSKKTLLNYILSTAYLPAEIPPLITTKNFAEFCAKHRKDLKKNEQAANRLNTLCDTFSVPRNLDSRRPVALVHPEAQLTVSSVLVNRNKEIRKFLNQNRRGRSFYFVFPDRHLRRAYRGLDFPRWRSASRRIASEYPFLVKADIERFFYTIYTHSLEWAVRGKFKVKAERLKAKKSAIKHWSSILDKALQSCQSRETHGIPVGPDTSRLIAEILLVGVESQTTFHSQLMPSHTVRLIDDYLIGFSSLENAEAALRDLKDGLATFNLNLNDSKTKIMESKMFFEEKWKFEIGNIDLKANTRLAQLRKLDSLVDLALHYTQQTKDAAPIEWACHRIQRAAVRRGNEVPFADALFRLARDYPKALPLAVSILVNNKSSWAGTPIIRGKLIEWTRRMLKSHVHARNDFEIAWVLFCCAIFSIDIRREELALFKETPGSVVLTLLYHLRAKGLAAVGFPNWKWRKFLNSEGGLRSVYWLPLYECVRQKWTTDYKIVSAIRSDPFFSDLLANNVTFIEDGILSAKRLDILKRTYRMPKPDAELNLQAKENRPVRSKRATWPSSFWEYHDSESTLDY